MEHLAAAAPLSARTDTPLLIATVVNAILALPGVAGGAGLVMFLLVVLSSPGSPSGEDLAVVVLIGAGILLVLTGVFLVAGYRRALYRGIPVGGARLFWWLSAGYNALGILASGLTGAAAVLNGEVPSVLGLGLPLVGWTAFMVWLSVSRALRS